MKYYSDILKKFFDYEEDCLNEEKEFMKKKAEAEKAKAKVLEEKKKEAAAKKASEEKRLAARKAAAHEIAEKLKLYNEAEKAYKDAWKKLLDTEVDSVKVVIEKREEGDLDDWFDFWF